MEILEFAALVLGGVAVLYVATRLIGRAERNEGTTHGGGYESSSGW